MQGKRVIVFKYKQEDDKNITDFTKRFKQALDNVTSLVGKNLLDNFLEKTQKYTIATDADDKATMERFIENQIFIKHFNQIEQTIFQIFPMNNEI